MDIQPKHLTLINLLAGRLFRIPSYQRSYSWTKSQRDDLFQDIRQLAEDESKSHFMATIVGLRRERRKILTDIHDVIEVVDGQQRITTLVILLNAVANALDIKNRDEKSDKEQIKKLLVKRDKASLLLLQTNHDSSNYYANYIRTGELIEPEVAKTKADREILRAIKECIEFVDEWKEDKNDLLDLVSLLKNRLTAIFHEIDDEKTVYTVFEVLNSRGLDVSWFDRLKSMLMANVFLSSSGNSEEHIKEVHRLWTQIYDCVGLDFHLSAEALRFAATLMKEEKPSRLLSEQDAVALLRGGPEDGANEVLATSSWLLDVTRAVRALYDDRQRDAVTSISQARLLAAALNLRTDIAQNDRDALLRRWENITFRIFGIHRRDARTAVGEYVRLAWAVAKKKISVEEIQRQIDEIGAEFPLAAGLKSLFGDADWYDGWREELRYFFYRREAFLAGEDGSAPNLKKWRTIWEAEPSESIEHILPQSKGKPEVVHRLGNLVLLPPRVNSKLGAQDPKKKKEAYKKTGLFVAQEVASALGNWTPEAIRQREKQLLAWAKKEWAD